MESKSLFILTIANLQRQIVWQDTQILPTAWAKNQGKKWGDFNVDIGDKRGLKYLTQTLERLKENNDHDIYAKQRTYMLQEQ